MALGTTSASTRVKAILERELLGAPGTESATVYVDDDGQLIALCAAGRSGEGAERLEAEAMMLGGHDVDGDSIVAHAFAEPGRLLVRRTVGDREQEPALRRAHHVAAIGLRHEGEAVGVLAVTFDRPDVADPVPLTGVAATIAAELEGRRAAGMARQPDHLARALGELTYRISQATERRQIVEATVSAGLRAAGADGIEVVLMMEPGRFRTTAAGAQTPPLDEWASFELVEGRDPFSDVVLAGRSSFFRDEASFAAAYPHRRGEAADEASVARAVVPLTTGRAPTGAIAFTFEREQRFAGRHRRMLYGIANVVALGLRRLEADRSQRSTLRALHDSLLTFDGAAAALDGFEHDGTYHPAGDSTLAGGDWFDVVADSSGRCLYAVLGDVAGHGPAAAGSMATLRAWIRAAVYDDLEPAEIADRVGTYVAREASPFATATIARLDPEHDQVTWCNAGHPYPVVAHADDASQLEATHGPPLGVARAGDRYRQDVAPFERGDSLVLFSDGLVEDHALDLQVGFDHLVDVVRTAHRTGTLTAERVVERMGGRTTYRTDDVAVLRVTRVASPR